MEWQFPLVPSQGVWTKAPISIRWILTSSLASMVPFQQYQSLTWKGRRRTRPSVIPLLLLCPRQEPWGLPWWAGIPSLLCPVTSNSVPSSPLETPISGLSSPKPTFYPSLGLNTCSSSISWPVSIFPIIILLPLNPKQHCWKVSFLLYLPNLYC